MSWRLEKSTKLSDLFQKHSINFDESIDFIMIWVVLELFLWKGEK